MPTLVTIPQIGDVEFPDGMNDADISAAVQKIVSPDPWYSGPKAFIDAYKRNYEMEKTDPNSALGQSMRENEALDKPSITLPRAPQMDSTIGQIAAGVYNGAIAPAVESMTSPHAVMTAPVSMAGKALSAVAAPVMAGLGIEQGSQAISMARDSNATLQQTIEPAAGAAASAAMAFGAGRHALKTTPLKPTSNAFRRGEISEETPSVVEVVNQLPQSTEGNIDSIQAVPRMPSVQEGVPASSSGFTSPRSQDEGVFFYEGGGIKSQLDSGNTEMRDSVRELPQTASRGGVEAPQEPTARTIETIGEGQLFRNDEIPFNLAGETDTTGAAQAAAEEIAASEQAKAAQDAAQVKMFEGEPPPPLESSVGEQIPQGASAALETPAALPTAEPAVDPLLSAIDADIKVAREAGDTARLSTLAKLKINYMTGKPPAIRKVQEAYGQIAEEPNLPTAKTRSRIGREEFQTAKDVFLEDPLIKAVVENGGIISRSRAKQMGGDVWENSKSFYDALESMDIRREHYDAIYPSSKKTGVMPMSPDKMAQIVWDAGLLKKGHPDELIEEIANRSGKMGKDVFKSHDQYMDEQAAMYEEQAATKGLHLSVDDMSPGDQLVLPSEYGGGTATVMQVDPEGNVTISMPSGKKSKVITMPAGNSLKVTEHIRSEERDIGENEPF